MTGAPTPAEIFRRAAEEGQRRLDQSLLELTSTSFIAGFTVVFGVVALGIVESLAEPTFGEFASVAGALAFGVGVVFLVVGRTELFNENFFDPVAAAVERDDGWHVRPLGRLWAVTFAVNILGGGLFALVFAVEGALPPGADHALRSFAVEVVARPAAAEFARAIVGGALVSMLSFLLQAVDTSGSRIALSYAVGVLLALGPFDHVVVTILHLWMGVLFGAPVSYLELIESLALVTAGNLVGGLGLVTLTHVTQAMGAREFEVA